jgi:MerR family redox-sensitive transcriptional activator SoxR
VKTPDRATEAVLIGEVARRTGVSVSAIRYYESIGVIGPARRVSGRRVYDDGVFSSIALVLAAQDAGFTLAEVRMLISGFDRATPASARWQSMAQRKLDDVVERIRDAERMKAMLERLLTCRCETLDQCVARRTEALRTARSYAEERPRRRIGAKRPAGHRVGRPSRSF